MRSSPVRLLQAQADLLKRARIVTAQGWSNSRSSSCDDGERAGAGAGAGGGCRWWATANDGRLLAAGYREHGAPVGSCEASSCNLKVQPHRLELPLFIGTQTTQGTQIDGSCSEGRSTVKKERISREARHDRLGRLYIYTCVLRCVDR